MKLVFAIVVGVLVTSCAACGGLVFGVALGGEACDGR